MHVPPGGGPPPHRHDFEEMFSILDGEIELSFRGQTSIAIAGDTVNIPANAPPPPLGTDWEAAFVARAMALAPKHRTQLLLGPGET